MKFLKVVFLCLLSGTIYSQNKHRLFFHTNLGIPTKYMRPLKVNTYEDLFSNNTLQYNEFRTNFKNNFTLSYSYTFSKRFDLGIITEIGINRIQSNYSINTIFNNPITYVNVHNYVYNYGIGLEKRFNLFDNINLRIYTLFEARRGLKDEITFKIEEYQSDNLESISDYGSYKYDIRILNNQYFENSSQIKDKSIFLAYGLEINFRLRNNLDFNFILKYTRNWNHFVFYSFETLENYSLNGVPGTYYNIQSNWDGLNSQNSNPVGIRDHFLDLGIGLTYSF